MQKVNEPWPETGIDQNKQIWLNFSDGRPGKWEAVKRKKKINPQLLEVSFWPLQTRSQLLLIEQYDPVVYFF